MKQIVSGIYAILNLLNGKRYVGSAVNLERRQQGHFRDLRNGKNGNSYLQNAFNKYGNDAFGWIVLKYVEDLKMLLVWEDLYLKIYWPMGLLYNSCPTAGSTLGYKHTEKTKQKMKKDEEQRREASETALKRWTDPEYIQMQRDTNPMLWKSGEQCLSYGKRDSAETKQRRREARLKLWADPEYRQMMFEIQNSPEYKRRCSEAHKGKRHSDKTKQRMKKAHEGKEFSEEHKHNISVARKKYWARKRAEVA